MRWSSSLTDSEKVQSYFTPSSSVDGAFRFLFPVDGVCLSPPTGGLENTCTNALPDTLIAATRVPVRGGARIGLCMCVCGGGAAQYPSGSEGNLSAWWTARYCLRWSFVAVWFLPDLSKCFPTLELKQTRAHRTLSS